MKKFFLQKLWISILGQPEKHQQRQKIEMEEVKEKLKRNFEKVFEVEMKKDLTTFKK